MESVTLRMTTTTMAIIKSLSSSADSMIIGKALKVIFFSFSSVYKHTEQFYVDHFGDLLCEFVYARDQIVEQASSKAAHRTHTHNYNFYIQLFFV
jgi:hypothetical protein